MADHFRKSQEYYDHAEFQEGAERALGKAKHHEEKSLGFMEEARRAREDPSVLGKLGETIGLDPGHWYEERAKFHLRKMEKQMGKAHAAGLPAASLRPFPTDAPDPFSQPTTVLSPETGSTGVKDPAGSSDTFGPAAGTGCTGPITDDTSCTRQMASDSMPDFAAGTGCTRPFTGRKTRGAADQSVTSEKLVPGVKAVVATDLTGLPLTADRVPKATVGASRSSFSSTSTTAVLSF